jgi:hypothetical protein
MCTKRCRTGEWSGNGGAQPTPISCTATRGGTFHRCVSASFCYVHRCKYFFAEEKTKRVLVLVGVAPQHASSCPQEERKGVSAPSGHQRKQFRLVEVGVRVFPGYSESAERVDDREGEPHELVSGFEDLCHLQATR